MSLPYSKKQFEVCLQQGFEHELAAGTGHQPQNTNTIKEASTSTSPGKHSWYKNGRAMAFTNRLSAWVQPIFDCRCLFSPTIMPYLPQPQNKTKALPTISSFHNRSPWLWLHWYWTRRRTILWFPPRHIQTPHGIPWNDATGNDTRERVSAFSRF